MAGLRVRFPVTEQGSGGPGHSHKHVAAARGVQLVLTPVSEAGGQWHPFLWLSTARDYQLKLISGRWGRGCKKLIQKESWLEEEVGQSRWKVPGQQGYLELGRSQNWGRMALFWRKKMGVPTALPPKRHTFERGLCLNSGRSQHSLPASAHS